MADLDLQAVHDVMVAVAYEAGHMILAANPADIDTGTKLNCKCPKNESVRPFSCSGDASGATPS